MAGKRYIYFIDFFHGAGFGSEFNNLLYAIYYFKQHHFHYSIKTENWVSSYRRGWNDYFNSVIDPSEAIAAIDVPMVWLYNFDHKLRNLLPRKHYFRIRYRVLSPLYNALSSDRYVIRSAPSFEIMRNNVNLGRIRDYGVFLAHMHKLAKTLWQPVPRIKSLVASIQPKEEYIAVHIRRGDKIEVGEDRLYNVEEYITVIRDISNGVRNVFVMSDDARVIQEFIQSMPEFVISFNTQLVDHGYYQGNLETSPPSKVRHEIDMLIAELEVARCGLAFVGTYRSNLFRLIEYLKGEKCYDISNLDRSTVDP